MLSTNDINVIFKPNPDPTRSPNIISVNTEVEWLSLSALRNNQTLDINIKIPMYVTNPSRVRNIVVAITGIDISKTELVGAMTPLRPLDKANPTRLKALACAKPAAIPSKTNFVFK